MPSASDICAVIIGAAVTVVLALCAASPFILRDRGGVFLMPGESPPVVVGRYRPIPAKTRERLRAEWAKAESMLPRIPI